MKRILIVEDEPAQAETYIAALNGAGWQVTWVQSIDAALHAAPSVDLILADRGLPDGDGLSLPPLMAQLGVDAPIILLTAINTLDERVRGLEHGAADYVGKGVDVREVVMRCEAQMRNVRRGRAERQDIIYIGSESRSERERIAIAPSERLAARASRFVELTTKAERRRHVLEPTAFALLMHLVRNLDQVVRVSELEHRFFHRTEHTRQGVRNAISKIRRCIDAGETSTFVHTHLAQVVGDEPGYTLLNEPRDPNAPVAAVERANNSGLGV